MLLNFRSLVLKAFFACLFAGGSTQEPLWAPNDMQVDDSLMIIKVGRSVC